MNINIYSIFDSAVKAFTQPIFCQTDAAAVRLFQDQVNRKDGVISAHPDQFTLMRIGSWNDSKGEICSHEPVSLGNGLQYKDDISDGTLDMFKDLMIEFRSIVEEQRSK